MELEALIDTAIKAKVIDPDTHRPLLKNPQRIAQRANIPVRTLFTSAIGMVTDDEYDWFKLFHTHAADGTAGLMIATTKPTRPVLDRFSALAGWAIRNSLRARVLLVQDLFDLLQENAAPDPDLLLIPDFVTKTSDVQPWQASRMASLLYGRYAAGQQTAVYVQAELAHANSAIESVYGVLVAQHVRDHFEKGAE